MAQLKNKSKTNQFNTTTEKSRFLIVKSLIFVTLVFLMLPIFKWTFTNASWWSLSSESCHNTVTDVKITGACWPVVWAHANLLLTGRYPESQIWRPLIAMILPLTPLLISLLFNSYSSKEKISQNIRKYLRFNFLTIYSITLIFLIFSVLLLDGALFNLNIIPSPDWGGFSLTLLLSTAGVILALPLALGIALIRVSSYQILNKIFHAFVLLVRGVPLVSLLFIGQYLLPFALPSGAAIPNALFRAGIIICVFQAASLSEVLRSGFLAIPQSQWEGAFALGMSRFQSLKFIILPQVLQLIRVPLINSFIGLVKDTALITLIGINDLLGIARLISTQPQWLGWDLEPLIAAAMLYGTVVYFLNRISKTLDTSNNKLPHLLPEQMP